MSNIEKLKTVMVGVGNFGAYRRNKMRASGLFDLIAAYDFNEKALEQCKKDDGAEAVDSYEALLNVPGAEAMIISTGGKFHAEQIIAAAEKGLHVFVEKPLCSTPEELKAIFAAQEKHNVVIGVGHADHYASKDCMLIKNKIDSGDLGKIAAFETTTCHSGGFLIKPGDWRGDPDKNPGGMLFQCGVHSFHELMFYFGPIEEISAMMRYDVHTTQTADVAMCHIRFKSGLVGSLNAYHVSPYRHTFSVFGTKRNLYRFDYCFDEGTKLFQQTEFYDGKKQPLEELEMSNKSGKDDAGTNVISFFNAIRYGKTDELYPSLIDGARAVDAVFAAVKSIETKAPVALSY